MSAPDRRPAWDVGAQAERTRLAWQRTGLSGLACSMVVAKLVGGHSAVLGVGLAALALITTGAMFAVSRRRYLRSNDALFAGRPLPDGRLNAVAVALIAVTGVGATAYAVLELIIR